MGHNVDPSINVMADPTRDNGVLFPNNVPLVFQTARRVPIWLRTIMVILSVRSFLTRRQNICRIEPSALFVSDCVSGRAQD